MGIKKIQPIKTDVSLEQTGMSVDEKGKLWDDYTMTIDHTIAIINEPEYIECKFTIVPSCTTKF